LSNSVAQALLACFPLPVACMDHLLSSQYNTAHLWGYTGPREMAASLHSLSMIEKCKTEISFNP
jgi:hypothetical protein